MNIEPEEDAGVNKTIEEIEKRYDTPEGKVHSARLEKIFKNPPFNCDKCGTHLEFIEKHDAYCCKKCDEWIEWGCTDPNCPFDCLGRPKPSEVKE